MLPPPDDIMRKRALALGLHGLHARWDEVAGEPWLRTVLDIEEHERQRRSLERRMLAAKLTAMKPVADFDWKHAKIDRALVEELFELGFIREAVNVVFLGPNGPPSSRPRAASARSSIASATRSRSSRSPVSPGASRKPTSAPPAAAAARPRPRPDRHQSSRRRRPDAGVSRALNTGATPRRHTPALHRGS